MAVEAGFIEYTGRVATGPIGHEIGYVLTLLNKNFRITVVTEGGKLIYRMGKGKKNVTIMRLGDYAYAPMEIPVDIGFESALTDEK